MLCRSFSSMPCNGEQIAVIFSSVAVRLGIVVGVKEGDGSGDCVGVTVSVGVTWVTGGAVFSDDTGGRVVPQAAIMDARIALMQNRVIFPQCNAFVEGVASL